MNTQVNPVTTSAVENVNPQVVGEFHEYDPQLDIKDIAGTRIVKCLYKQKQDGTRDGVNSYVRIPDHLTDEVIKERFDDVLPFVITFLQNMEDKMIQRDHRKGLLRVFTDGLKLDKILEYLESIEQGGRLKKEQVFAWFDDSIKETLVTLFADKLGIDENSDDTELAKLETVINAYREKFASLAGGKTMLPDADCDALIKVIDSVFGDKVGENQLAARFKTKLQKMKDKEIETLLEL